MTPKIAWEERESLSRALSADQQGRSVQWGTSRRMFYWHEVLLGGSITPTSPHLVLRPPPPRTGSLHLDLVVTVWCSGHQSSLTSPVFLVIWSLHDFLHTHHSQLKTQLLKPTKNSSPASPSVTFECWMIYHWSGDRCVVCGDVRCPGGGGGGMLGLSGTLLLINRLRSAILRS